MAGMKEILSLTSEAAGWIGALGTTAAYALVSLRRIAPDSAVFHSMNMAGAALLAISAASNGTWPVVTANFVWIFIGVQALVGARRVLGAAVDETTGGPGVSPRQFGEGNGEMPKPSSPLTCRAVAGSDDGHSH